MSFVKSKHFKSIFIIFILFFLENCQLREPSKIHGINFLNNRSDVLVVNKSNKNDVIKVLGKPHSKSLSDKDKWMYFERVITRGKMHKLGQNILKTNNVLELRFNARGVLVVKNFYDKESNKKVKMSKDETSNNVSQPSFVRKFLGSVKQKMYGNRSTNGQ